MLTVFRSQSQVTIPDPVISSLGLKEGDWLEIFADNGIISMIPVTGYPDKYVKGCEMKPCNLQKT